MTVPKIIAGKAARVTVYQRPAIEHTSGDTLADYIADHYGACALADCRCLRLQIWLGRGCIHWRPVGAGSMEELAQRQHQERS
jgi:hypothetical protein